MLIKCDRHTAKDLEIWAMHEEADASLALVMQPKIDQALNLMREWVQGKRVYVATSWGKDSLVVAHMAWLVARDLKLIHLRPTNHNPDCDEVRDLYFKQFPGQPYEEIVVDYTHLDLTTISPQHLDKETDKVWWGIVDQLQKAHDGYILGIRSEESTGRRLRIAKGLAYNKSLLPIGHWQNEHVFAYLYRYDLPIHPAYAMCGGGRYPRRHIRVAEIGDNPGDGMGRAEWEKEYYGDFYRRMIANSWRRRA